MDFTTLLNTVNAKNAKEVFTKPTLTISKSGMRLYKLDGWQSVLWYIKASDKAITLHFMQGSKQLLEEKQKQDKSVAYHLELNKTLAKTKHNDDGSYSGIAFALYQALKNNHNANQAGKGDRLELEMLKVNDKEYTYTITKE